MTKYSFELTNKVVMEYLQAKGSYNSLASKYGILSSTPLKHWVKAYEHQGADSLMKLKLLVLML